MSDDVMLADLAALLRALGLFDGAQPESPHRVMQKAIAKAGALRNAALDEAAKVCDEGYTAAWCAKEVRALKT